MTRSSLGLHQRLLTAPPNQGTAVLIHFHTWHRGTKRLLEIDDSNPRRPMVKFQFFAPSDPLEPSWAHDPSSPASTDPFGNVDAPETTKAIWEDSLAWMKGEPSPVRTELGDIAELVDTINRQGVEHEQARIGAAYTLGQAAKGGNTDALIALQTALRTPQEVEVLRSDREGGKFAGIIGDPGDQSVAIHRAGIWGLAAAGDAAVPGLLSMLGDGDVGIVQRAAHALSEAAEYPDAAVVQALGSAMDKLRATIDLESEGLTLDEVAAEWRMAVFASREYHTLRRRPEWMALDIVAQSLWQVAQRAVARRAVEAYTAAKDVLLAYVARDLNLPPQTRMNAAYGLLSLSTADWILEERADLLTSLGPATMDDDRYVMAAAVEAVRRLTALASPFMAERMYDLDARHAVESRWCPITNAKAPF